MARASQFDKGRVDAVRLAQQNTVLSALLMAMPYLPNVASAALETAGSFIGASRGCLLLLDRRLDAKADDRAAYRVFFSGFDQHPGDSFAERLYSHGIIAYALYERRPILIRDLRYDPRYTHLDNNPAIPTQGAAVAVPLRLHDDMIGALVFFRDEVDSISDDAVRLIELLSQGIAGALRGAAQVDGLQNIIANANYRRMAAAATEQIQRDLLDMTVHDLRAPLSVIQNSLSAAERLIEKGSSAAAAEILHSASHSARQLNRMVKSLLDLGRLENGRAIINRQPIQLNLLFAEVVDLVRPLTQAADQTLVVDLAPTLPAFDGDPDMIIRVIINLVENATKYSPRGGAVTLTARALPDFVVISVIDQGPGIPPHLRDEVFDKYFRIKRDDGAARGVGLGLAFCRLAVEAHGGRIWVDSADGGGSIFAFTLPVAPDEIASACPAAARTN